MRQFRVILAVMLLSLAGAARGEAAETDSNPIRITIDATKTGPPINPFIYGQFIEHLGRCIYGGIWAEMLEDRKFYFPITDKYDPYRDLKNSRFPVVGASPWEVVGPPNSVTMVTERAYVGEHSPRIAAGSGIRQNDLGLVAGKQYAGYIWLRAPEGKAEARISLVWGDAENDRELMVTPVDGNEFVQYPFQFKAGATTDRGRLTIEINDAPVFVGAVSLMPADNIRGFRADTIGLLKQLNATIYRWPGGNFVSGYDWRDGLGPRDRRAPRKNPAWTGVEHNDVGIDEFIDLCREIGAEPMIAVNTGFGDDYSAAQEVEYANSSVDTIGGSWRERNGRAEPYGVKYWCVGNEMWGRWQLGYMELGQYTQKHNRVAAAMRKVDPNLVLVASGDLGTKATLGSGNNKHEVSWSEGMLEQCSGAMDFISEHFYKGKTPWGEQPPAELPAYVGLLKNEIRNKANAHRDLQQKLGRQPDRFIPIAMDEWNYWHREYIYGELGCQYTLADALGIAAGLHEYFRNSDIIHMANYAQTVNVIGCIKTTKTDAFLDTTALPLLLYRREFGTLPLRVTADQTDSGVDVAAAKTDDGRAITIAVVNPQANSQAVRVTIDGIKLAASAHVWRIAGDDPGAINTAEKQSVNIAEEKHVPFGEQLTLPPYSVSLYRVPIE